ncbi:MAG: glycosyltransferase family 2 protein [Oscillospiraceae bacterium]|jgi:glycosyltransferase involved in cell wall biosynthesis
MPKVSIIVPVYNVEPYLRQCMDSLVNQTLKDIEIIAVDDGSPDNCGAILDEYAAKDSRIKLIHKKNEGLCAARNDALKLVTGEWIAFVDSDDWCELNAYEVAYKNAVEKEVDILIYNHYENAEDGQKEVIAFPEEFVSDDPDLIYGMVLSSLSRYHTPISQRFSQGFPWDKLFKASLLLDNGLVFATNVKANEDVIYDLHAFHFAKKIAYIKPSLYHYRMNPTSIGHSYKKDRVEIDAEIYKEMEAIGKKYGFDQRYWEAFYSRVADNFMLCCGRCFFHKNNAEPFAQKIKRVRSVMLSEPYKTAFKHIQKGKVAKRTYAMTHGGNKNPYKVWLIYQLGKLKHSLKAN